MYGTVMIGKLRGSIEDVTLAMKDWAARGLPAGFRSADVMLAEDGETVVSVVHFESRETYRALAENSAQDEWWRMRMQPLLDGEPRWIDGSWVAETR